MNYGYQQPEIQPQDYVHGDGLLGDLPINPTGQWDNWLPTYEAQNRGFETYACVSEATSHCVEILQRKKWEDATDYSVRFLATLSGTGIKHGNEAGTVAETLRKFGCCQEKDWPFGAVDFNAFYTAPPQNIQKLAKLQFADNSFGHSWLTTTTPDAMKNALAYSPLALGVWAWSPPDADGIYHRPKGAMDVHCVAVVGYLEDKYWVILDSYSPNIKKLDWNYGFGFGKRYTLDRRIPTSPTPDGVGWVRWDVWIAWVKKNLLGL